ncbi:MAG: AsmA-like C-terminal region-containing protein [Hyphomicrobiales bacterium]
MFIIIGSIIVTALVAVLVAPFFIDWSDHKQTFEREASALIGHPVRVKGDAEAKILPIPTFTFTNVEVGETNGKPIMSAARIKMRLELIPLVQRQFHVIDMELDEPQISARFNEQGKTNWKLNGFSPKLSEDFAIKLGPISIKDGAIYAVDELTEKSLQLKNINAIISAQSLLGPWKLNGAADHENQPFQFKVSTGKFAAGKMRVKTKIEPQTLDFDTILDGEFITASSNAAQGGISYKGILTAAPRRIKKDGETGTPIKENQQKWELTGAFDLNREKFSLNKATFEDGAQEAPVNLNGNILIPFSPEVRFEAKVSSRQIDLDRSYGEGQNSPIALSEAQSIIATLIDTLPKPPIPGTIDVNVPGIIVAGDIVRSLHFKTTATNSGWHIDDFSALFPGSTRMGFTGDITTGDDIFIEGDINLRSTQPVALARWLQPESGKGARRISTNTLEISGKLIAESTAISLTKMNARLGTSDAAGRLTYNQLNKRQKQFEANLRSKTLDVDAIQALSALFLGEKNISGFNSNDTISLKLEADKLISQALEGRSANVNMRVSNGEIDITTMKIEDFAGLNIDVAGTMSNVLTTPAGRFNGKIKAQTKDGLIKIGDTLIPTHPVMNYLHRHGDALMPLDVIVNFSGDYKSENDNTKPSDFAATIAGKVGGGDVSTGIRFQGNWQEPFAGDVEASFNATYANSVDFLNQAGWNAFNLDNADIAEIDIRAKGKPQSGIAVSTDTLMNGVKLNGMTTVTIKEGDKPKYKGDLQLIGDDSEPLMRLLGFSLPASGIGTDVDLKTEIQGEGWEGELKNLNGTLGGSTVNAQLAYKGASPQKDLSWKWQGEVKTEHISLPWLVALGTGEIIAPIDLDISPEGVGEADKYIDEDEAEDAPLNASFWSSAQYGAPYLAKLHADISMSADAMDLTNLRELETTQFDIRLRPQSIALNKISGKFSNGDLNGSLLFENNEGAVTLSGIIDLKEADASDLLWSDENRPLVEGKLSLSSQFSGTGRSLDAIISTLGGGGSISLTDGRVRRLNPAAFQQLVSAADDDILLNNEVLLPLTQSHLDSGHLTIDKAESTFTITSGVGRIANASLTAKAVNALAGATFDLPQMTLKGSMALNVKAALIDKTPVAGSTPEIAILFDGPIDKPSRTLDVQPLLGYLTVRRFEQEVRRVEVLQADILEKQRLSRYARWISAEAERERQEALEAAERKRKAEIEAIEREKQAAIEAVERNRQIEIERKEAESLRAAKEAESLKAKKEAERLKAEKEAERLRVEKEKAAALAEQRNAPRTQNPESITRQDLSPINIEEELRKLEQEVINNIPPAPLPIPSPGASAPLELRPQSAQ